jgi:FixJ family two-component response regulator
MLRALRRLLEAEKLEVRTFGSAAEFLECLSDDDIGCLVLDVAMPGLDGLELQRRLAGKGTHLPIVFLTGHGDIPMSVRAIKGGAIDFLTKPVKSADLLRAIHAGIDHAAAQRVASTATAELRARLMHLTPREREVFEQVIAGKLNKVIAGCLGTTEQTIKVHRGRVMAKLGVHSVAELVRAAQQVGVTPAS